MKPQEGTYVQLPFEALLAVIAQESARHECIVIGEDLGTVPEGFRETMADWGLWSYLVMLFERRQDGSFKAPSEYKANALASFSPTTCRPSRAGRSAMTCGETRARHRSGRNRSRSRQRAAPPSRMRCTSTTAACWSSPPSCATSRSTPTRLVIVSMEDALDVHDQPNLPGTIDQHPNWLQRLPVLLEDLNDNPSLHAVGRIMANTGRRTTA